MEIVHNDDNGYLDWLIVSPERFSLKESTSILSGNGKGFTLAESCRCPYTEL